MAKEIRKIELNPSASQPSPVEAALGLADAFSTLVDIARDTKDIYVSGDTALIEDSPLPIGFEPPETVQASIRRQGIGVFIAKGAMTSIEDVLTLQDGLDAPQDRKDVFRPGFLRVGVVTPEMLEIDFFSHFGFVPELCDPVLQAVKISDREYQMTYVPLDETTKVEFKPKKAGGLELP